jgi:hypothetical protein
MARLLANRPSHPAPLILVTDPNKDPDDLNVLVLAAWLQRHGFIDLRAVVTTLGDRQTRLRRARFAKDVLEPAAAPRGFYDGMAATCNSIGLYLRDQQRQSLANLWSGIHQGHLPPALTPTWFFKTFTDLDVANPAGQAVIAAANVHPDDFEPVWQRVSRFNLYDPLALLAATPGVGERLFHSAPIPGARGDVRVIGADSIADPAQVKDLLAAIAISSLGP